MNILFISPWFPVPPANGSKIRIFHLIRSLGKQHTIDLASFIRSGEVHESVYKITPSCTVIKVFPWQEFSPTHLKALIGFFSKKPRSVFATYQPKVQIELEQIAKSRHYDVVIYSEMATAPYLSREIRGTVVLDDLEIGILSGSQQGSSRYRKFLTKLRVLKLQGYLSEVLEKTQLCTVVSEVEKSQVQAIFPNQARIEVVPNGVDTKRLLPGLGKAESPTLIYAGSVTYSANFDAVSYFIEEIFPIVRSQISDVRFVVTGSVDGTNLSPYDKVDGVKFLGHVRDIHKVVADSAVSVIPLRIGGGTRLKILESFALGTPVVSTSKGVEGLDAIPEEHFLLADDSYTFAQQTIRLLKDEGLQKKLAMAARKLVEERYDWEIIGQRFTALIEQIVSQEY